MPPSTGRPLSGNQLRVQIFNLARRVESLEVHRRGLEQAAGPFGGGASGTRAWREVFDSHDPTDVVTRNGVTGCYSAFVNNYIELLKTSAYLVGLTSHKRDHAKEAIELVRVDGGISKGQASHLHQLYVFEGRVQHASLAVDADEVIDAVNLLRSEAAGLIKNAVEWLDHRGLSFSAT